MAKPILLAIGLALALAGSAAAQQPGTTKPTPDTSNTHVGHDVCKTHPNLPQCK